MDNKRIKRKIGIIIILSMSIISFVVGISTARAGTAANPISKKKIDIRFLVDMSYPMKEYDPNNIRIRTLQKIVKALPEDANSGVWTYGKYVNMLVPLGAATPEWKKQAIYKLDKIGGYGEYRNITEAVSQALHGWQSKPEHKKYMVILTNGDLRIATSKAKNAESQLQLLTKVLPKLKNANIELHTISLGKNADNRLLKALASQTNGKWYSVASAELLTSVVNHVYSNIQGNNSQLSENKEPKGSLVAMASKDSKDSKDSKKSTENINAKATVHKQEKKVEKLQTPDITIDLDSKNKKERKEMDFNWPTVYSG